MVTVKSVKTFRREDGSVESEAVITAADGDTIVASDLELLYISYIKSVQPLASGHVAGAATVTNPDSVGNSATLTLYSLTANADSLVAAGSVDWLITAVQL